MTIIVIDIGGTWLRSAKFEMKNNHIYLGEIDKNATPWRNHPLNEIEELEDVIANYINEAINKYNFNTTIKAIGVSLGTCMSHIDGTIYSGAPILGKYKGASQILKNIYSRIKYPTFIINDVSALALGYFIENVVSHHEPTELGVLTLSSGIGFRRIRCTSNEIVVDETFGIQGEVGHLSTIPIHFPWPTKAQCDCGGSNHYGSYLSGNGLNNVFNEWLKQENCSFRSLKLGMSFIRTKNSVISLKENENDDLSKLIINKLCWHVSQLIDAIYCICPEIDKISVTGGVVSGLLIDYEEIILKTLSEISYIYDEAWFTSRITFETLGDSMTLKGIGYYTTEMMNKT